MSTSEERTLLAAATLPLATQIAARAFFDDPLVAWLFPHEPARPAMLKAMMRAMVGMRIPLGHCYLDRTGEARGLIATEASGRRSTKLDEVRSFLPRVFDILPTILRGPHATEQLRRTYLGVSMMEEIAGYRPSTPHYYVAVLSVDPQHQGTGVGSQLLRSVLADADREHALVHLETSRPENQSYYRRFGFETVREVAAHGAPPVWIMARPAH